MKSVSEDSIWLGVFLKFCLIDLDIFAVERINLDHLLFAPTN